MVVTDDAIQWNGAIAISFFVHENEDKLLSISHREAVSFKN